MKRLLYGLATILAVVATSMVWTQPAQAAPPQCTVTEWRDPTRFKDCANRAREAMGEMIGCIGAPTPGSPTSGMPGWFTSRPDSALRDGVAGQYSIYGVGGYGLDTYDLGCLGSAKHPDLLAWNTIASAEFSMAASIIGASNGLRETAYDPGSMWGWSDEFIRDATDVTFRYIFSPFGGLMFAVIGVFLLWRAPQGQMSEAMKISAWAVLVMVAATAAASWPVQAARGADAAASKGLSVMHDLFGPGPQDVPAEKCALGPTACKDNRSTATRSSDVVTEAVLYRSWLRAVLGTADSPTAQTYGPALYDATTMKWEEAARIAENPDQREGLIAEKAATWNAAAEKIRVDDPEAYEHLQGVHGSDRAGAGAVALISAASFSFFDMAASLVILFAFLILRVAIVLLPMLATVGVFLYSSGGVRRIFHMSMAACMNILVFGAGAGLYQTTMSLIFRSDRPGYVQIVAVTLSGAVFWLLLHPARRLVHTATGRARTEDGLLTRVVHGAKEIHAKQSQPTPGQDTAQAEVTGPRPENAPSQPAGKSTSKVVLDTVAPTVATLFGHPEIAAGIAAINKVRNRPEHDGGTATGQPARSGPATIDGTTVGKVAAAVSTLSRPETRS